jgi:acyl carrier protein
VQRFAPESAKIGSPVNAGSDYCVQSEMPVAGGNTHGSGRPAKHKEVASMPASVAEKVLQTLAAVKRIPLESITLDSALADLKMDSLDAITLLFELEKQFNLSIADDEARSMRTVRQVVDTIERLLAASPPAQASAPGD